MRETSNASSGLITVSVKCGAKTFQAPVLSAEQCNKAANPGHPDDPQPPEEEEGPVQCSQPQLPLKTVGELRQFIAERGNFESGCGLKIIHRGKCIGDDPAEPLSNYQFKKTDKLMVVGGGKAPASENDAGMKGLLDYEKNNFHHLKRQIETNANDLSELERHFLEGEPLAEMIRRMDKRLKLYTEISLRHLENLDAIPIYHEKISEEQRLRNREKRRYLVHEIQNLMSQNDKLAIRLEQYVNQLNIEGDEKQVLRLERGGGKGGEDSRKH